MSRIFQSSVHFHFLNVFFYSLLLNHKTYVGFEIFAAASMKMAVVWVVVPYSLVVYRCFRGACCLHYQCDDDGGSKRLWNVGKLLPDYTVQQPRRQPFLQDLGSILTTWEEKAVAVGLFKSPILLKHRINQHNITSVPDIISTLILLLSTLLVAVSFPARRCPRLALWTFGLWDCYKEKASHSTFIAKWYRDPTLPNGQNH
jgi:hypothetical protein